MEFLKWLDKNNLLDISKSYSKVFEPILKTNLKAEDEKILIISDHGYPGRHIAAIMSAAYYLAAKNLGMDVDIKTQDAKSRGEKAGKEVKEAILDLDKKSIIILNMSNRLGSLGKKTKSFRQFAKKQKHRFISTPSLGLLDTKFWPYIIDTIDIDYRELVRKGTGLMELMDKAKEAHIKTAAGTDFYMNISTKKSILNDGIYNIPCMGGNLPAGEVYTPPYGKRKIYGKVVIDATYSYRYGSKLVKEPIVLDVEKDEVINIKGGKEAKDLQETLSWAESSAEYPWGIRRIGELGIGINPNANILGATIVDEKSLGSAHVAIGSNYWFGGTIYALIHLDQVMRDVTVYIDDEKVDV